MLKKVAISTVVVMLLVLTGCDPGSNSFAKKDQPDDTIQVALMSSNNGKVLK